MNCLFAGMIRHLTQTTSSPDIDPKIPKQTWTYLVIFLAAHFSLTTTTKGKMQTDNILVW